MCRKFSNGGGEETCHSRPRDSHGFPISRSRTITVDQTKLMTKMRIEPPRTKDDIETQSFSVGRFCAYSNTRRGWPRAPAAKRGRNVELKAMNMTQNWIMPRVRFSRIP